MPPQNGQPAGQNTNPAYDFLNKTIVSKSNPLTNVPKPVAIIGIALIVIISFFVVSSQINKHRGAGYKMLDDLAARQQEIVRVSEVAKPLLKTQAGLNTLATAETSVHSDEVRLITYLSTNHAKIGNKQLAIYANPATDSSLNTGSINNQADQVYLSYLKQALTSYQGYIVAANAKAPGPNARLLLSDAYSSAGIVLSRLNTQ